MGSLRNGSSQMITEWKAVVGLCVSIFLLLSSILLAFSGRGEGRVGVRPTVFLEINGPFTSSLDLTVLFKKRF